MKRKSIRINGNPGQIALFLSQAAAADFATSRGWTRRDALLVRFNFEAAWCVGQLQSEDGRYRFLNVESGWTDLQRAG
ncbi:MAG: hypothetical protein MUC79_15395 [Thiobacillaceae bacterium]|jgi:hypothetical protein|nr:hypothetical protein [Thiobacillaceae bacterium]